MRQVLFVLAIVGAVLAGWMPAVAATLDAAPQAGMHAMHHAPGGDDTQGKAKASVHPFACSACFAIEAARVTPPGHSLAVSSRIPSATPQFAGRGPCPLDPPPRS